MEDLISLARIAESAQPLLTRSRPRKYQTENGEFSAELLREHLSHILPDPEDRDTTVSFYEDDEEESHMVLASLSGMSSDSQLSCSSSPPSPSPSPPPELNTSADIKKELDYIDNQKRGRGRPRKQPDGEDYDVIEDLRRSRPNKKKKTEETVYSDDSDEAQESKKAPASKTPTTNSHSVRRVPCFFASCTHSYRRPNSNIVEFSDRPLVLQDKYNGYTIRSCKKHHDWWRNAKDSTPGDGRKERPKGPCEICRGLNESISPVKMYSNRRGMQFFICGTCAYRQADVLSIQVSKDCAPPSTEVITIPGPTRFSPPRTALRHNNSGQIIGHMKAPKSEEITFYNAFDPFSQRIHLALIEKEATFNMITAKDGSDLTWLHEERRRSLQFLEGPAVKLSERCLFDADTCIEWIDEMVSTGYSLMPQDATKRAEVRSVVAFINREVAPIYGQLATGQTEGRQEAINLLSNSFSRLSKLIDASSPAPYTAGSNITLADVAILPYVYGILCGNIQGFQIPSDAGRLLTIYNSSKNRPSFKRVFGGL